MIWLIRTFAIGIGKAITLGEYQRIKRENKKASDYALLMILMRAVASKRLATCRSDELSRDCPIYSVINDYYQPGKTTSGTRPLRLFTVVGLDGQVINIQAYDLAETVKVTVRHTDGKYDTEDVDPSDAVKRLEREAGYRP